MASKDLLNRLDELWYDELHDSLPSGVLRAIGRFAFGILKEMVRLSSMGHETFPEYSKGYVLEKVLSIIRRTGIERNITLEILKYWSKREITSLMEEIDKNAPSSFHSPL